MPTFPWTNTIIRFFKVSCRHHITLHSAIKQEDYQHCVKSCECSVSGRIGHLCLQCEINWNVALWRLLHMLRDLCGEALKTAKITAFTRTQSGQKCGK